MRASNRLARPPLSSTWRVDRTKSSIPEKGVEQAQRTQGVVPVTQVGIVRIPMRHDVFDRDAVTPVSANCKHSVRTNDVLSSPTGSGGYPANVVIAPCHLECGHIVKDEPKREKRLWSSTVVVVALAGAVKGITRFRRARCPWSATVFVRHHLAVAPSESAVLEMRKVCRAMQS
jgi:hypothetical protein